MSTTMVPSHHTDPAAVPDEVNADDDRWRHFGRLVLEAHHRYRGTHQCTCGQLVEHCQVLDAARRLDLPTDDPVTRERAQ